MLNTTFLNNPLIVHQIRRPYSGWTARRVLIASIVLHIVALLTALGVAFVRRDLSILAFFLGVGLALMMTTVPFMAFMAGRTTDRFRRNELLYITTISNWRLVSGYLGSALYRTRRYLVLATSFIALYLLEVSLIPSHMGYLQCVMGNAYTITPGDPCALEIFTQTGLVAQQTLVSVAVLMLVWSLNLMGILLGSALNLVIRHEASAILAGGVLIPLQMACFFVLVRTQLTHIPFLLGGLVIPAWIATLLVMFLAVRRVRG